MKAIPGLDADRLKRAINAFIRELFPTLDYYRPHLYTVASWDDDKQSADLVPAAPTSDMPNLAKVAFRSPYKVTLPAGFECVVWFDSGDPTRPFIGCAGQFSSAGSQVDGMVLSDDDDTLIAPVGTTGRVVRYGDPIVTWPGGVSSPGVVAAFVDGVPRSYSRVKA